MKKIIRIFILLLVLISAVSCGNIEETPSDGGGEIDNPIVNPGGNQGTTPDNPVVSNKVEFKVSLIYNKEIFIPKSTENIQVVWADDYMQYTSTIGNDGYAKIELDGDFHVFLNTIPEGYSYNPNIYNADNDNPVVEIELYRLARISKGQGTELYKEYKNWDVDTFSFMQDVIRNITINPSEKLRQTCPHCGAEVTSNVQFPNGIKAIFNVATKVKKFGSR